MVRHVIDARVRRQQLRALIEVDSNSKGVGLDRFVESLVGQKLPTQLKTRGAVNGGLFDIRQRVGYL